MGETPKFTPKDLEWGKAQLEHPKPIYLLAELVRLSGPNLGRVRLYRMLIRKGVIQPKDEGKGRRVHMIPLSRLMAAWPEFWWSIRTAWEDRLNAASRSGPSHNEHDC